MKLRFGIDATAEARIRGALDARCKEPPVGRRLSYVYLDTPDGALAAQGVALRFRRSTALGAVSPRRPWRRQTVRVQGIKTKTTDNKATAKPKKLRTLLVKSLKQRLDATFDVRIERWTWTIEDDWASVSLDDGVIATGRAQETFAELRVACKKRHRDDAMALAVELGATHLASLNARERGQALLRKADVPPSG